MERNDSEKVGTAICVECGSAFLKASSKMDNLCPECSHILYGYENCKHSFVHGKCKKCLWDGSRSEYVKKLLSDSLL